MRNQDQQTGFCRNIKRDVVPQVLVSQLWFANDQLLRLRMTKDADELQMLPYI
ncbi:MAG: hypothetical protein NVSMB28_04360 [Collimonas sp.]